MKPTWHYFLGGGGGTG